MLFATTSLAARLERAEAESPAIFGRIARQSGKDVLIEDIGGGIAVYAGPGQPFNKIAGLGFAPLAEADLAALEAEYDRRGGEMRVELSSLAPGDVSSMLTRRGYVLGGDENALALALTPDVIAGFARERDAAAARGIEITPAGPADMRTWIDTVVDGFLHPDVFDGPPPTESFERQTLEDVFGDQVEVPGGEHYLARRDGVIAGGGSMRLDHGVAILSGASTLPAHRRRGVQSALLRARLVDAASAGCDIAVITTEPGSKSQENVQRIGFALLYVRAILVRRPRA